MPEIRIPIKELEAYHLIGEAVKVLLAENQETIKTLQSENSHLKELLKSSDAGLKKFCNDLPDPVGYFLEGEFNHRGNI